MISDAKTVATAIGPVQLYRSNRKTLSISVLPNGAVSLMAPMGAPLDAILDKVRKRSAWIRRQQRSFVAMNAHRAMPRYVSGATHRYLGRQYRLKVRNGTPNVKLSNGYFHVTCDSGDKVQVEKLLSDWMRERAHEQFSRRLARWHGWCQDRGLAVPTMSLRMMPKRWGSAQRDGRLFFNPELVRAPSICIDYVIAHEVCHLQHPHHGPLFYQILDEVFPRWRFVKERLERAEP